MNKEPTSKSRSACERSSVANFWKPSTSEEDTMFFWMYEEGDFSVVSSNGEPDSSILLSEPGIVHLIYFRPETQPGH